MKKDERYYKTADFYASCYLLTKDFELVGIDKTNPRRAVFSFRDKPERELHLKDFWQGRGSVEPRLFIFAIKELKSKLNNY